MWQSIDENQERIVTVMSDGAMLVAIPNYDEESIARAQSLGYDNDIWRMTKEHECLHKLLAEAEGLEDSISLWYASHPKLEMNNQEKVLADREERVILFIQRLLNIGIELMITPELSYQNS